MYLTVARDPRPLVLHVVFRFDTGGLENGVVNLINGMPEQAYRHAILSLKNISHFRDRVCRKDTQFIALNKLPGHGVFQYSAVWKLLKEIKPAVVHTRNLGPLEMQVVVAAASRAARIHGEHGRDIDDIEGLNRRHQYARRLYSPFIHRYVALSRDLQRYLVDKVGVSPARIEQIYNGVDADRFRPALAGDAPLLDDWPFPPTSWVIGNVGRMQGVKNPALLAHAFARALSLKPELKGVWRLVLVGEGPLRAEVQAILDRAGLAKLAWLPGERADIPGLMRRFNCFVLPSLSEGISNTILEAMACALPVVATDVGGNAELVQQGRTGLLVEAGDIDGMAQSLLKIYDAGDRSQAMGAEGRREVESRFSLPAMVGAYQALYDKELARAGHQTRKH